MLVAVAGGTGTVGRPLVETLTGRGHRVRVLARSAGVDLVTGDGLDAALADVECVVDVSNVVTTRRGPAVAFFTAATSNLLAAGERAGVRHHVVLSIVGVDRVGYGYYQGKRRQEDLALAGPVPATVLRTTQFHEFAGQMLDRMRRGPVVPVPRMAIQPVAVAEVVRRLADLAAGPAAGRVPDLAGPRRHDLVALVRRVARARRAHVAVVPVRLPGRDGRLMAGGGLLPGPDAVTCGPAFDEWLAAGGGGSGPGDGTRDGDGG